MGNFTTWSGSMTATGFKVVIEVRGEVDGENEGNSVGVLLDAVDGSNDGSFEGARVTTAVG